MNKTFTGIFTLMFMFFNLSGCSAIGSKNMSMSIIYIVTSILSVLLIISYCCVINNKEPWFLLLFSSIFVVNTGYLTLAISKTIEEALLANRIAYLGSAFLPLSMLMIIFNVCHIRHKKFFIPPLLCINIFVFLLAATPGYLDIYYQSVTIKTVNGITVLDKVYGPWHQAYLYYLLIYFGLMIGTIVYSVLKKKIDTYYQAVILVLAVSVNIGVWLLEQLVAFDFEILSISYIVCGMFLLSLQLLIQKNIYLVSAVVHPDIPVINSNNATTPQINTSETDVAILENKNTQTDENNQKISTPEKADSDCDFTEKCNYFASQVSTLTPTELKIYNFYLEGKTTKDIITTLNIKENTLKYHNKNIYSKLGVTSRKQLVKIAKSID